MSHVQDAIFREGDAVRIKAGPFSGFTGKVESISEDHRKLKVMVEILWQGPPVEVFFLDVERLGSTDYRKN
jgi:transcription antitermination factor NusG